MNEEAKRMMLLGSINGTINELDKMCKVEFETVACLHYIDKDVGTVFSYNRCDEVDAKSYHLSLEPLQFGKMKIGSIGRCSCGKVYYKT